MTQGFSRKSTPGLDGTDAAHAGPDLISKVSLAWPEGGDDLMAAKDFCAKARCEMDAMIYADRTADSRDALGRDPHWLSQRLSLIQRGAKRSRARAIYRCAQDVLTAIQGGHAHMPIDWAIVDGRLVVLNKLLGQYSDGLEEVIAEFAQTSGKDVADIPSAANDGGHECARQTLESLLPHARPEEREALDQLLRASQHVPDDESPAMPTEPLYPLEEAMPDMVQQLLAEGRDYGKILSVSYALETVELPLNARNDLVDRLKSRLGELIASAMPLQGIGHLDITNSDYKLVISGTGFEPFTVPVQTDEIVIESALDTPRPRITEDTEADLRAQLSALMDAGLTLDDDSSS